MNIQPQNNQPGGYANQQQRNQRKKLGVSTNTIVLVVSVIIIGMLGGVIYLLFRPPFLTDQRENQAIINKVSDKVEVPEFERPTIALIANADNLREDSPINAEVYKDAQDGDYVLGYSDKIVIYRKDGNEIIYDGPSPVAQLEQTIIANIRQSADILGLDVDPEEQVQISVVTDPDALRESNAEFYANADSGDIIATFPRSQYILIYRPSSGNIVNDGQLDIAIN